MEEQRMPDRTNFKRQYRGKHTLLCILLYAYRPRKSEIMLPVKFFFPIACRRKRADAVIWEEWNFFWWILMRLGATYEQKAIRCWSKNGTCAKEGGKHRKKKPGRKRMEWIGRISDEDREWAELRIVPCLHALLHDPYLFSRHVNDVHPSSWVYPCIW